MTLPTDYNARKALPIFDGVVMYFPDALAAVAQVSVAGNAQHNPGQKLHWSKHKSSDHYNTALRHMIDHAAGQTHDSDKTRHLAKAAWRVLAALQISIEEEESANKAGVDNGDGDQSGGGLRTDIHRECTAGPLRPNESLGQSGPNDFIRGTHIRSKTPV